MAKFKVGDIVYYRDDYSFSIEIIGIQDETYRYKLLSGFEDCGFEGEVGALEFESAYKYLSKLEKALR